MEIQSQTGNIRLYALRARMLYALFLYSQDHISTHNHIHSVKNITGEKNISVISNVNIYHNNKKCCAYPHEKVSANVIFIFVCDRYIINIDSPVNIAILASGLQDSLPYDWVSLLGYVPLGLLA